LDRALLQRALLLPESLETPTAPRAAAVSVLLSEGASGVELLLIRRSERPSDPWSGHMAFPGGHQEPGDVSLLHTAIRETREEIGLDLERDAELLGALEDLSPVVPRALLVRPFVFALPRMPALSISAEVDTVVSCPLVELAGGSTATEYELLRDGNRYKFPAFQAGPGVVWGLTYRVVTSLLYRVERARAHSGATNAPVTAG
jgi:8-oxo-dGTP pyrophosphatase MutT (NUDIX family)